MTNFPQPYSPAPPYAPFHMAEPEYFLSKTSIVSTDPTGRSRAKASFVALNRRTDKGTFHRPLNISFRCSRSVYEVDAKMRDIYNTIIAGGAHTLLTENPHGCPVGMNTGHCGNMRKNLAECKCVLLDRKTTPHTRQAYEDLVIGQVMGIIGHNTSQFNVRIAMFATGMLHGEQCLLIRLVDTLKKANYAGTIHVSLIDTEYKKSIDDSHAVAHLPYGTSFSWAQLLGNRADFNQFITELSLCLSPDIFIKGSIFGSAEDYAFKAQQFGHKHDLMIGADLEGADGVMDQTNLIANRTSLAAIALVKRQENSTTIPKLCLIKNDQEYCYKV
ncbi:MULTISPECIES: hypothetical protein [Parachlamydia]|jgi:hypothetical protein|uniref:hypothetical protein n=1 Tax=Parachlamydia TaxID=83551 RepID=UPI0001C17343|nr:hypothetical protein [Parachlamydia acanthamoebae]EFB40092.1 hypothetical protein pah_c268o005 [Parachlamydia acanthamoebae str. Hall's coccus]